MLKDIAYAAKLNHAYFEELWFGTEQKNLGPKIHHTSYCSAVLRYSIVLVEYQNTDTLHQYIRGLFQKTTQAHRQRLTIRCIYVY